MNAQIVLPQLGADPRAPFPPTRHALDRPNGLLAWGGGLEPERLLAAYRHGIFPWYSEGQPILWWSPAPRCVIRPERVHVSRRTRRRFNSGCFTLSLNTAFAAVIAGCADPRDTDDGTWITPAMVDAYTALHRRGQAHSLEVWADDELAGGIYGLAIGGVFFGESMFSRRTDASKVALIALCRLIAAQGYGLLDCQVENAHLRRMGAESMTRDAFECELGRLLDVPVDPSVWRARMLKTERW
jgi:leucyl/phenylalanyl-tRNA--protein transferase